MPRSRDHRENLAELDAGLRSRLLALDEPVDRSDWDAVVERSRTTRLSRYRSYAVVASGAAVLSLAVMLVLTQLLPIAGQPRSATAPLRLVLRMNDGTGLVLYSEAKRASFLNTSDDRLAGQPSERTRPAASPNAAVIQALSGGPFHVDAALAHADRGGRHATAGPLPGDQVLISFPFFTTAGLERRAGSAVLTCLYGFGRNAYCDGSVDMGDGMQLTASGTLRTDANDVTLAVTSDYGRAALAASPRVRASSGLD